MFLCLVPSCAEDYEGDPYEPRPWADDGPCDWDTSAHREFDQDVRAVRDLRAVTVTWWFGYHDGSDIDRW